jgi:NAD(P)-dependent dehydrogenase (short-subunit alcohol dehydrogenase family)
VACNVSEDQVERAFQAVREKFGGVDILVNYAGIIQLKLVAEETLTENAAFLTGEVVNVHGGFLID